MNPRLFSILFWSAVAGSCWIVGGCTSKNPATQQTDASNLRPLASLWSQYTGQHQGRPPASEEEFKTYIKGLKPETLTAMKIADVDKQFVSERDNKPYTILYGGQPGRGAPGAAGAVMGHEQEGRDGKRIVAMSFGQVRLVDDAEFQRLVPASGKKP